MKRHTQRCFRLPGENVARPEIRVVLRVARLQKVNTLVRTQLSIVWHITRHPPDRRTTLKADSEQLPRP